MRLINTCTFELEEFLSTEDIRYAILSHRWEQGEVSFQDYQSPKKARLKKGYRKIICACNIALRDGYKYIWIDTCCIDKSSSSELSEALNSMFRWYQEAFVCYVYLSDVTCYPLDVDELQSSLWFTRGWTLQELLAPRALAFFNNEWIQLGWKHELTEAISEVTGISPQALRGQNILTFSISQRMSWASRRTTTRVEDRAYSLMGLFNVNMPMLYGEGHKAFIRLQEEIIKHSDDQTIFAWSGVTKEHCGLLAPSVSCFADIPNFEPYHGDVNGTPSYSMTNQGLSIEFDLSPRGPNLYLAQLRCYVHPEGTYADGAGIYLSRLEDSGQFVRTTINGSSHDLYIGSIKFMNQFCCFRRSRVNVRQGHLATSLLLSKLNTLRPEFVFRIMPSPRFDLLKDVDCYGTFNINTGLAQFRPDCSTVSVCRSKNPYRTWGRLITIDLSRSDPVLGLLILGFDFDTAPVCVVTHKEKHRKACKEYRSRPPSFLSDQSSMSVQRPFDQITCMESHGWDVPHNGCAVSFLSDMGLWAIKGSRSAGLDVCLSLKPEDETPGGQSTDLRILISLPSRTSKCPEMRTPSGMLAWTVSFRSWVKTCA